MSSGVLPSTAAAAAAAVIAAQGHPRPWWTWARRGLTLAFFLAVAFFIVRYARNVDWHEVWESIAGTPAGVLAGALALAACSHLLYSCFDLLGRRYTGHTLAVAKVMQVNFISYAFNLNLGSLVGGVAFRYRLYSRLGLDNGAITRVITLSMLTNWLGYLLLAGAVFAALPLALPPQWKMDGGGLRWLGVAMLALGMVYLGFCALARQRSLMVRGHELLLPRPRMAALQVLMSCANWLVMGGIIFVLLQGKVVYVSVLSVLLIAAVAGVITHVPAGLGVLEGVFVALLSHQVPGGQLLGALLTYRAIYYLGPMLLAGGLYVLAEARAGGAPAMPDVLDARAKTNS